MTWDEAVATVLGMLCVALSVIRSVWTFPTAIGSVTLLGVVVARERLYSDALLQLFFAAANLYGWFNWRRSRARAGTVVVERLTAAGRGRWLAAIAAGTVAWGWLMHRATDAAYPWWDGGIAVASLAAQVLMGQRKWENWWLWIAIDVASVPLYAVKHLWAFAGLYLVYLAMATWGLIDWRRAYRAAGPEPL